jgi:hypothetical protein
MPKEIKPATYYEEGIAIHGERIAFKCRKCNVKKAPIHGSSAHKAQTGTLDNAYCVINKRFRHIPEKED